MALTFDIKVTPSSGRQEWKLDKSGVLKCYLKSPAEQGKANSELIKSIATRLGISQNQIVITAGMLSRKKRIKIETNLTYDALLSVLGIHRQIKMF